MIDSWAVIPIQDIRNALRDDSTVHERIAFTESYIGPRGFCVRTMQDEWEMLEMIAEVSAISPSRVVEIGTGLGGLSLVLAGILPEGGILATLDLPEAEGGGPAWKDPIYGSFPSLGAVKVLRGNSHATSSFDECREAIGGLADFLFIDANHTYRAVEADFWMWARLVRPGGYLGFHDLRLQDVGRFWQRLKRILQGEFSEINNAEQAGIPGNGIGLWRVPDGD